MYSRSIVPLSAVGAVLAAASLLLPATAYAGVVYSNDFSVNANGFSDPTLTVAPATSGPHDGDQFLGQLGNETETLSLTGLAPHSSVTVDFDLYVIQSMDGDGPAGGGPDPWSLFYDGTNPLIQTNFANFPGDTQTFDGPDGSGGYLENPGSPIQSGASEVNTLGYQFNGGPMDSVYDLSFTFLDTGSSLTLDFVGDQNQPIGDESWGLDNVVVSTDNTAAPEPGAGALLATGLITAAGLVRVRRRRRAA